MEENKDIVKVERELTSTELLDRVSEGNLALFQKTVSTLAEITEKNPKFIAESILKGQALGLKPYAAYSAFWDMTGMGAGAEIKTDALMGFLVSKSIKKGGFIKPFEIVDDCAYVYYYFDGGIEGLNEVYKEYDKYIAKSKEKIPDKGVSFEAFAIKLLMSNLYTESNPANAKEIKTRFRVQIGSGRYIEVKDKSPIEEKIYERVTTLKAYRRFENGIEDERRYSYYLSTAIKLGIYRDKQGNIKKEWNNLNRMMRKRCTSELCSIIAPDIVYPFEDGLDISVAKDLYEQE